MFGFLASASGERGPQVDFNAVQQQAFANGEFLSPSSLRALIVKDAARIVGEHAQQVSITGGTEDSRKKESGRDTALYSSLRDAGKSLVHLPDSVIDIILSFADAPTLSMIACTAHGLNALASDDNLWCARVKYRFEPVRWALPPLVPPRQRHMAATVHRAQHRRWLTKLAMLSSSFSRDG